MMDADSYSRYNTGDLPENTQDPTEKPKGSWVNSLLDNAGKVGVAFFSSQSPELLAAEAEEKRKAQTKLVIIVAVAAVIAVIIYYSTKK